MDNHPPSFDASLAAVLPALQAMRDGLGPKPSASLSVLQRLREVAGTRKSVPAPVPSENAALQARSRTTAPAAASAPSLPLPDFATIEALRAVVLNCTKCPHLVRTRTQVVFGVGNVKAELMFVGEAPGADEDAAGEPFVGKAGQLLTKIIQAMGYTREEVYIANVLKCRPDMPPGASGNRKPRPEEMKTCLPWLEKQIALIRPRVMVALGATALEGLLGETGPVGKLRGKWQEFRGIPVMPTYHPAYLLRNQSLTEKRKVWEDMLQVLERLERPISEKQRRFFTQTGA